VGAFAACLSTLDGIGTARDDVPGVSA
jgi:hypothetical protein